MNRALYSKQIMVSCTGMVVAKVFCGERRVGLKFFSDLFSTVEGRCKKAHAWADKHIEICAKYEVGVPVAKGAHEVITGDAHIVFGKNGKTIGDNLIPQLQTGTLLLTEGKG